MKNKNLEIAKEVARFYIDYPGTTLKEVLDYMEMLRRTLRA